MAGPEITMEAMEAAAAAIGALPPAPQALRMNLTTAGLIVAALPENVEIEVAPFLGLPMRNDPGLATGIVEVDWSDERIETIDFMVREV